MRVRIERAYRSRSAELINDITLAPIHVMRICVYLPACPCSKEQGGGGEEKGYASRERRNKNTMVRSPVGSVLYRDTRCTRASFSFFFFFFIFP